MIPRILPINKGPAKAKTLSVGEFINSPLMNNLETWKDILNLDMIDWTVLNKKSIVSDSIVDKNFMKNLKKM